MNDSLPELDSRKPIAFALSDAVAAPGPVKTWAVTTYGVDGAVRYRTIPFGAPRLCMRNVSPPLGSSSTVDVPKFSWVKSDATSVAPAADRSLSGIRTPACGSTKSRTNRNNPDAVTTADTAAPLLWLAAVVPSTPRVTVSTLDVLAVTSIISDPTETR